MQCKCISIRLIFISFDTSECWMQIFKNTLPDIQSVAPYLCITHKNRLNCFCSRKTIAAKTETKSWFCHATFFLFCSHIQINDNTKRRERMRMSEVWQKTKIQNYSQYLLLSHKDSNFSLALCAVTWAKMYVEYSENKLNEQYNLVLLFELWNIHSFMCACFTPKRKL